MEIEIRKATIKDLKTIQELNHKLFKKEYAEFDQTLNCDWTYGSIGTKKFRERITKDDRCALVAIIGGKIVGYLVGSIAEKETYRNVKRLAELGNMYILRDYQRFGIGTKLFNEFFSWCRSRKATRLKVVAFVQNTQAINFYRKNGFKDYNITLERDM